MPSSRNFAEEEFACKCCGVVKVSQALVDALQKLRDLLGKPIIVTNAYRCPKHNKEVGGAVNSLHMRGTAADITVEGMELDDLYRAVSKIPEFRNGGIGIYPQNNFIHVDLRSKKGRWLRLNGKYLPIPNDFLVDDD